MNRLLQMALEEGFFSNISKRIKNVKDATIADARSEIKGGVKEGVEEVFDAKIKGLKQDVDQVVPKVKKGAKLFVAGVGGVSLGGGSYLGNKLANRKKKIKESNIMLFSFAIGTHSALAKIRNGAPNFLIQEGVAGNIRKISDVTKKGKSILSPEKLGKAMYSNPKAMDQAFRLYGSNSKTIKKAIPTAFGRVRQA